MSMKVSWVHVTLKKMVMLVLVNFQRLMKQLWWMLIYRRMMLLLSKSLRGQLNFCDAKYSGCVITELSFQIMTQQPKTLLPGNPIQNRKMRADYQNPCVVGHNKPPKLKKRPNLERSNLLSCQLPSAQ
mmetsp:Transcript_27613/g.40396  ORF Transcript_27613/g.40396 Transcript_27613/m.40396 type:complete len:128 (+) Transcript_27613:1446-1829(+)